MKTDFKDILAMSALMLSLSACGGQGFESLISGSLDAGQGSQGSSQQDGGSGSPDQQQPSAYDKLELNAYVAGGNYDSAQVLALDKKNNALLLYLPLPPGPFADISVESPKVKGLKIKTVIDSQQNARVAVSIPLKYIVKDKIKVLPTATRLPSGADLPLMPSGEYPLLGLSLNNQSENKMHLYLGTEAVGLFVESSFFPEYIRITSPIKNKLGTITLGYLTIVPKSKPHNGGLFLSFIMPKDLGIIIDDHLSKLLN